MWFLLPQHFGLRGCQEHHDMHVKIIPSAPTTTVLNLWLIYEETPTKTHQGGLCMKQKVVQPKMFATSWQRCSVKLFKTFLEWRPKEMWNSGPFHLAMNEQPKPKCGVSDKEWVSTALIFSWRIRQIRQTYKAKSSQTTVLAKPWWRSWKLQTNCGQRLSACANERSLEDYEEGDKNEQWDISSIISAEFATAYKD